jgi:hypothetical protein
MRRTFGDASSCTDARGILGMLTRPVDNELDTGRPGLIALPLRGGWILEASCYTTGLVGHT